MTRAAPLSGVTCLYERHEASGYQRRKCCHCTGLKHRGCSFLKTTPPRHATPSLCHKASPARELMQTMTQGHASKLRTAPRSAPQPPPERGCCYSNAALTSDNVGSIKSTKQPQNLNSLLSALKVLLGVFTFPSFGDGSGQERVRAGLEGQQRGSSLPPAQQDVAGRGQTWPRGLAPSTTGQRGKLLCLRNLCLWTPLVFQTEGVSAGADFTSPGWKRSQAFRQFGSCFHFIFFSLPLPFQQVASPEGREERVPAEMEFFPLPFQTPPGL